MIDTEADSVERQYRAAVENQRMVDAVGIVTQAPERVKQAGDYEMLLQAARVILARLQAYELLADAERMKRGDPDDVAEDMRITAYAGVVSAASLVLAAEHNSTLDEQEAEDGLELALDAYVVAQLTAAVRS